MRAGTKGLLLGLANVLVVGLVIGALEAPGEAVKVMVVIAIMAGAPALAVGMLCGWLAGRLVALRRTTLIAIPLVAVAGMGLVFAPELILPALPSTMLAALGLEWWTREDVAPHASEPVSPVLYGALLGLANVLAVTLVLAIYLTVASPVFLVGNAATPRDVSAMVLVGGVSPGMIAGALAGLVTRWLRDRHELTRLAVLGGIALAGVLFLAVAADALALVGPALLPTLGAVILLERRTRAIVPVPSARVHRAA